VEFPEEDESAGDILVGFLGPDCNDIVQMAALNVLLTYLSGSSVSVLEHIMVEQEQLASSVSAWWDSRLPSVIWLQPTSVATEKLVQVEQRLFEILKDVAAKPIDMSYMTDCIKRERRQLKFQAESSEQFFATNVINDFLFGKRDGSTLKDLATVKEYDILETWTDQQWREFLKKWISDANHVSILGKPSKAMAEKLEADEIARVAAQKEKLGPEGLKKLAEKLEEAKNKNNAPIPKEILEKWPVPGVSSIHFIESTTARSGLARKLGITETEVQKLVDAEKDSPLFIQFEHVPTNFVSLAVLLAISEMPVELRPLLSLFIENFFNTPIMKDGEKVDFQQVVTGLEKDTISYSIGGGSRIGDAEGITIQFQIEPDKYIKTVQWIRTLMFDSVFDETRLQAALTKMLADIPEAKRSGSSMLYAVDAMIHLAPESVVKARNTLVKAIYLKRLKKLLEKEPKTVIYMLETLRKSLFTFNNFRVLVIADVEKLPSPVQAWHVLIEALDTSKPLSPIVLQHERLSIAGYNPGGIGAVIVPMPTVDSSFCLSSAKGLTSYTDPQLPALMVAISYLDAVEGPLWTAVRGTGLAYGTGFSRDLDGGFIQFRVYRSPDAYKAFAASRAIIQSFISGKSEFEDHALEGAISAIVVAMADEQPTMATAAQVSFVNSVIRGLGKDYNAELMKRVRQVSVMEIKKAMEEVLLPAFTPGKANVVVTCAPIMEEVRIQILDTSRKS
jgi:Zn-dependent M16 (insulinase) family peptidase